MSVVSFIKVKGVISDIGNRQILGIDRTTEELNTIVLVGENFNMIDSSLCSDPPKSESVNLVTGTDFGTPVADGNILKSTGRVVVIGSTVSCVSSGD